MENTNLTNLPGMEAENQNEIKRGGNAVSPGLSGGNGGNGGGSADGGSNGAEGTEGRDGAPSAGAIAEGNAPGLTDSEELQALLREAYLRGRNENIEARIEADYKAERTAQLKAERKAHAADLIVRGIVGVAKAIFRPGRRSVWPRR